MISSNLLQGQDADNAREMLTGVDAEPAESVAVRSITTGGDEIPQAVRPHSKIAALIAILFHAEGASLDEMIERTGWQAHTVRAAMTGLRKKGYVIGKRMLGNVTVWFIGK